MIATASLVLLAIASGYQVFSLVCAWWFRRWQERELARAAKRLGRGVELPPVTILKPLRGAIDDTYETLATFCALRHARIQILFGVAEIDDPVVPVVSRLKREFPAVDIELVVSNDRLGANAKVSNLHNMLRHARYETLLIADSDIRIHPDALTRILPYLEEPDVGLVTCLYRASGTRTLANRLEGLFINTDFGPMVTVAKQVETTSYAFGAAICIRRTFLESLGGFPAIADCLADDYVLGNLTVRAGKRAILSPEIVETRLDLDRLGDVFAHQLRWGRTYRVCRPASYLATVLTQSTLWAVVHAISTGFTPGASLLAVSAIALRAFTGCLIASAVLGATGVWSQLLLVPAKDLFNSAIWALAFMGNRVRWGETVFEVNSDGRMTAILEPQGSRQTTPDIAA